MYENVSKGYLKFDHRGTLSVKNSNAACVTVIAVVVFVVANDSDNHAVTTFLLSYFFGKKLFLRWSGLYDGRMYQRTMSVCPRRAPLILELFWTTNQMLAC